MDTMKTIGEIPSRVFIFNNLLFLSNYQIKVSLRVLIVCALACPRSWRDPSSRNLVRNAEKSGLWIVANISHVGNPIISLPINNRDSWASPSNQLNFLLTLPPSRWRFVCLWTRLCTLREPRFHICLQRKQLAEPAVAEGPLTHPQLSRSDSLLSGKPTDAGAGRRDGQWQEHPSSAGMWPLTLTNGSVELIIAGAVH